MVMEDVGDRFHQNGTLNRNQTTELIKSLAKMHSKHWNQVGSVPRGSFWVLAKRKPLKGKSLMLLIFRNFTMIISRG